MSWLASFGVGLLTAIPGLIGTFFSALLWVDWFRVSSREGMSSTYAAFLGLVGGLVGLVIGVICARVVAAGTEPGFLKSLGLACGTLVGLLALVTAVCWLLADFTPRIHDHKIQVHAELRCPPGFVFPQGKTVEGWYAHIDTRTRRVTTQSELELGAARTESGHAIVPVTLSLETSVREKFLYFRLGETTQVFLVGFSAKSAELYQDWSQWTEGGATADGAPLPPEKRFALRYRLEEVIPPPEPTGPSEDEVRATALTEENAALEALTPESPLEESMKFMHYTQSEERRYKAGAVIARRPAVVAELEREIVSDNAEIADRALRAVPYLKPLPAGLAAPVGRVGDSLIADLERVVAIPVAEDSRYQAAADFSVKFGSWFSAHCALHAAGLIDGRPQFQKILALARQRPDSHVLKVDVARIAEHYLKEWDAPASVRP